MKTFSSFVVLVIFIHFGSSLEERHPHGVPMKILSMIEKDGKKQFITETENIEKIFLHPDVKDRKIVVLSIIGAYRKGKSFFLDYCLRFLYAHYRSINNMDESKPIAGDWIGDGNAPLQGFSWKYGSIADTKGIILWSDVFLHDTETEKIAIVVMDTQGLFEPGVSAEENGRIFGLSTLLSSIQILNIMGVLQEDHLEYLETATSLTNFIVKKQKSSKWKPFQRLLFLFRDWSDDDVGYKFEGGNAYLENTILKVTGNETAKANVIRKNIRSSFDEMSCFLLNHPGLGVLKKSFKGEWSQLETDFISNLKDLIESLLMPQNLVRKLNLGNELTAEGFQSIMKIYFDAFANAKLPDTDNILQIAIDNQMQTIVNAQLKVFNQLQADHNLDFNREDFVDWVKEVHSKNTKIAVGGFLNAEKLDDDESSMKFEKILKAEIEISFVNWKQPTMKAYDEFQEQKRQREIENCFNFQVKTYQKVMNKDIDFNQDDCEKYYENLHKTTMENALKELEKMRFKDENEKVKLTKSLADELNENYPTLRASKVKEYNQHLKSVSMLAISEFEAYKKKLNLNINYENQNFESYINEKHLTAKNAATSRFLNSAQQLTFKPRKTQFNEKLIAKIDSEYQTWKEAKMKAYNDNLKAVSALPDKHFEAYKADLNRNVNYESYQNFDSHITNKHLTAKNAALTNFDSSISQLSFAPKMSQFKENLISKINSGFNAWKTSTVNTYNSKVNQIFQQFVSTKLSKYRSEANTYIDVSQDNCLDVVQQRYTNAKSSILVEFQSETNFLNNAATQLTYKSQLSMSIDSACNIWYLAKSAERYEFVRNRKMKDDTILSSTYDRKLQNYKNTIENLSDDYTSSTYETNKRSKLTSVKSTIISEFNTETSNIHDRSSATSKSSSLSNAIDSFISDFMFKKMITYKVEYNKFLENRKKNDDNMLSLYHSVKLQKYKDTIERLSDDFTSSTYESDKRSKLKSEKPTLISEFDYETRNIHDRASAASKSNALSNDIDSFIIDFMSRKTTKRNDMLRNEGIWVPWSGSKSGVPEHAVIGGDDEGYLYFARATISGQLRIGKYKSTQTYAKFSYGGKEEHRRDFEVFTHTHYKFLWRPQDSSRIIGNLCSSSSGSRYGLWGTSGGTRNYVKRIPGMFKDGACLITFDGGTDDLTYNYDNLVRKV